MPLIDHPTGNYRFLPGISPYSCGGVASPGYEVVHVTFQQPPPYREGMQRITEILQAWQRPLAALCGVELRCPRPYSFAGFREFNAGYAALLESWGIFVDGMNPVARTNVAPVLMPPAEPLLYGFSFTRAVSGDWQPTFVVAGGGELPEGKLAREDIIALGDTSPAGIASKAQFVMGLMENRLQGLQVDWSQVSQVDLYTAHSVTPLLPEIILSRLGTASLHGVHWHFTRPPIEEIEFEMDLRGTRTDLRY